MAPRPRRPCRRSAQVRRSALDRDCKDFDGQDPGRLDRPVAGQNLSRSRYLGDTTPPPYHERRAAVASITGTGPNRTYLVCYLLSKGQETVTDQELMQDFGWRNLQDLAVGTQDLLDYYADLADLPGWTGLPPGPPLRRRDSRRGARAAATEGVRQLHQGSAAAAVLGWLPRGGDGQGAPGGRGRR